MQKLQPTTRRRSTTRRVLSAITALIMGAGFAVAGATAANAVAIGVSIQATSPTTQASGATFTYQINLACSGTNAPTCNDAIVTIPLDPALGMPTWGIDVSGGPSGFIQSSSVVGDDLVVVLDDTISAGTSQSIILELTPPNLITPDGTTWSLLPTVTSADPDMDDTTAPTAAQGTATATVPLTVAKTSDRTFYAAGETITYTLRATCPATKPFGSVSAENMTIVDALPAGLTFVSSTPAPSSQVGQTLTWTYQDAQSVPVACGGTAPWAASEEITVTATVDSVGSAPGDAFGPYENVDNTVDVTADPVGGGTQATGTSTRTVVMLAFGDAAIPGVHSLGKSSAAPLNRAPSGSPADRRATYPGRWLPNGDNSTRPASVLDAAPATYTISPRIQYESFQYEIRDKMPCLADLSGTGIYTQSAGVCAAPAFHVLGVRIDYTGGAAAPGYAPEYLRTDGSGPLPMTFETSGSTWAGWVVPTADLNQVAEIIIPRDVSQQQRLRDNIRVYGYADPSTQDGQTLQNRATISWYLGNAATVIPTDGTQTSGTADIFILNAPQAGVTKTMTNIGGATGIQSRIQLTATLFTPGTPTAALVVTDLLPADTPLVTNPTTITAQLTRPGGATISLTAAQLEIDVISGHVPGRDLIRITLPLAELPAEAGQYTLTPSPLVVEKPTRPGVYNNTARVFYDNADLMETCAAGSFTPDDVNGVREDPAAITGNCEANATFRTVTSSSGQFALTKTVQGDYDTTPQQFPAVGHVKLTSGVADYALNWENTGAPDLDGVVLYDVLPHVGDTGVSQSQAGDPRGSQFQPTLTSVGAAPANVTISYSASADACRPEVYPSQGACTNDWDTDPNAVGGLANVLAIRMVSTAAYQTGEGFSIDFQMSVPTVNKDVIAWNSVAAFAKTTTNVALLPTESPKVGITASDERFTIGKVVDNTAAMPGDTLTYEVTVGNTGTRDSVATTVNDQLPVGVTFVSADNAGVYTPATRTVSWNIPVMARDTTIVLTVVVTVDAKQANDELVNRAIIINPADYSPPIVDSPCVDDPEFTCARSTVPRTPLLLGFTGGEISFGAIGAGVLALVLGATLLFLRRGRATA